MRLTNEMRKTFIQRVMNDVPRVDYVQQIEDRILAEYVDALPTDVRRVWDNLVLRGYVHTGEVRRPDAHGYVCVPAVQRYPDVYNPSAEVLKLLELHTAQKEQHENLRDMLRVVAWAHNTDRALREALPEFADYIPSAALVDRTVPTLTGVVGAFKDAGWPAPKK